MSRNYLASATVAAVACVAASVLALAPSPATSAPLREASQQWQGAGFLHARFLAPDGTVKIEEWLDTGTSATRRVEYDASGARNYTVVKGLTILKWNSADPSYVRRSDVSASDDLWLQHASNLLQIKRMLARGRAEIFGSAKIGTTATWRVRPTGAVGSDAPTDFRLEVQIDQSDYLPRRIFYHGNGRDVTIDVVTERLASVSPDLFTGPTTWSVRDTRLSARTLKEAPFPVWFLGETYEGAKLVTPTLEEQTARASGSSVPRSRVWFSYAAAQHDTVWILDFTERLASSEQSREELQAYVTRGIANRHLIGGAQRTVYLLPSQGGRTHFAVVLGATLVTGNARMGHAEVLSALSKLKVAD